MVNNIIRSKYIFAENNKIENIILTTNSNLISKDHFQSDFEYGLWTVSADVLLENNILFFCLPQKCTFF